MEFINIIASVGTMGVGMFAAAKVTHVIVNEINIMMTPLFKKFGANAVELERKAALRSIKQF